LSAPIRHLSFRFSEKNEIIHVPDITRATKVLLNEVIQTVEIKVGEELTREIPDGQTPSSLDWREQVIALKPTQHRFLRITKSQDHTQQFDCSEIGYLPR
jgi:hypothetical protein